LFESRCDKFSSYNNPFQGKICWTIAPGNPLLYKFAQIRWVGVEDAGARLLPWKAPFLCELRQTLCWLHNTRQIGESSQMGTGSRNANIAEGTASRCTDLNNIFLSDLARKERSNGS
jgi:hypothetical protein